MREMKKRTVLIFLALLIVLSSAGCGNTPAGNPVSSESASESSSSEQGDDVEWGGTVVMDGKEYRRRTDLKTVLFLGIDDTSTVEAEDIQVGNQCCSFWTRRPGPLRC